MRPFGIGIITIPTPSSPIYSMGKGWYLDVGFVDKNGVAWVWGNNEYGDLGVGTYGAKSIPTSVVGSHVFSQAAVGGAYYHSLYLCTDGTMWSCGHGYGGQLGNNSAGNCPLTPVSVAGNHSFILVGGVGYGISAALKANGSAWTWGNNEYGSLGDNTANQRFSPFSVVGGHSFTQIHVGAQNMIALRGDGKVFGWGYNGNGYIGDNTKTSRSSPVSVAGPHSFIAIAMIGSSGSTGHALALKADGSIWCWGDNYLGELGDNTKTSRSSPVSVAGGHSFKKIACGEIHSMGLKEDGSVWTWGYNGYGGLGDNTTVGKSSPVSVVGGHSFINIMAGEHTCMALKDDGIMWGWGYGGSGQLGNNLTTHYSSPVSCMAFTIR